MNWIRDLNNALDYIETHLTKDLDYDDVAQAALTSRFHFMRLFKMVSGMSVGEYVRLRRLSLAASDILTTKEKIIDIALKYGYETPESFTKAFRKCHGVAPSEARKYNVSLKAIPPLSFQLTVKGETRMDYKIIEREAFHIVGFKKRISARNNENFRTIPKFWEEMDESGKIEAMMSAAKGGNQYGVCLHYDKDAEAFDYYIAVEGERLDGVQDSVTATIPASKWAVFTGAGPMPDSIQKVWKQIFHEWFPATNYEHAGTAEFEVYPEDCMTPEGPKFEIWIPIVEK